MTGLRKWQRLRKTQKQPLRRHVNKERLRSRRPKLLSHSSSKLKLLLRPRLRPPPQRRLKQPKLLARGRWPMPRRRRPHKATQRRIKQEKHPMPRKRQKQPQSTPSQSSRWRSKRLKRQLLRGRLPPQPKRRLKQPKLLMGGRQRVQRRRQPDRKKQRRIKQGRPLMQPKKHNLPWRRRSLKSTLRSKRQKSPLLLLRLRPLRQRRLKRRRRLVARRRLLLQNKLRLQMRRRRLPDRKKQRMMKQGKQLMPRRRRKQPQRRLGLKNRLRSESRKSPLHRIKPRQRLFMLRKSRKKPKALMTRRRLPLQNNKRRLRKMFKNLRRLLMRRIKQNQHASLRTRTQCARRRQRKPLKLLRILLLKRKAR
mmetsp:Transcript_19291/g.51520  ORF Transcript_19291/g.51520 Transcript_19291/m.51520 type:complete len:365 (+) Transcript_19291:649-1743(+)